MKKNNIRDTAKYFYREVDESNGYYFEDFCLAWEKEHPMTPRDKINFLIHKFPDCSFDNIGKKLKPLGYKKAFSFDCYDNMTFLEN